MKSAKLRHSITRRLIVYVVLFSSFITLLITALQLFQEYFDGVSQVKGQIVQIKKLSLSSVTENLWNLYEKQIQAQLKDLIQLPDVEYLEIHTRDEVVATAGRRLSQNTITETLPLVYLREEETIPIGKLVVVVTLDSVYEELFDRILIILISNAIKTTLVSLFIFLIFQSLVTRHLAAVSSHLQNLTADQLDNKLILDRRDAHDELSQVVTSINEMGDSLSQTTVSKNYVDNIIASMADGLIVVNSNSTIRMINKTTQDLLDYTELELIGESVNVIFADGKETLYGKENEETVDRSIVTKLEATCLSKKGRRIPVLLSVSDMHAQNKETEGRVYIIHDITQRKRAEQEIKRLNQELEQHVEERTLSLRQAIRALDEKNITLDAINKVQARFIDQDPEKTFEALLSGLLKLTDSEYGFGGEVLTNPEGKPYLKTHAISNIAWNDKTEALYQRAAADGMEFFNLNTLFGTVLTSGEPLLSNNPAQDPRAGGLPHGHPTLSAFLGVPVLASENVIGIVGVANRPGGYDNAVIERLQPFLRTYAGIILAGQAMVARVQAEQQLREREMRLRAVLDNVVDGIITIDEHSRIRSVNPALEAMFDYAAEELLGQSVTRLMPEQHRKPHLTAMRRYHQSGRPTALTMKQEVEGLRKDGTIYPVELTVSEVDLGDQRLFTGVLRDITDRKLAEEELEQRRRHLEVLVEQRTVRLKDANEELRRFAYIVSHDLRAPLVNIKGFAVELGLTINSIRSLLEPVLKQLDIQSRNELEGLLGADINESLDYIDSSVNKMSRQINAILKLSRLDRLELQPERVETQALVNDALRSLAHEIDEQGVQVDVGQLPVVMADRIAMEQIVSNILDNAIKYLDSARAGSLAVYGEHAGENTFLYFRDNGRGISATEQSGIYELFGRAGAHDKPGEGMGLAYVHSLLRRMGGEIRCQSELGKGTVFTVAIPDTHSSGGSN